MDTKSILIGALLIVVAVLGYLYWDSQHNTILKAPGEKSERTKAMPPTTHET
jgi:hypothetical protein